MSYRLVEDDIEGEVMLGTSSGALASRTLSKVTEESLPRALTSMHHAMDHFGQHMQNIPHHQRERFLGAALSSVVNIGLPILQGFLGHNRDLTGENELDERGFFDVVTKIGSAALPVVSEIATQFLGGGKRDFSGSTERFVAPLVPQLASIVVTNAARLFGAKLSSLPRASVEAEAEAEAENDSEFESEGNEIARITRKVLPAAVAITQSVASETRDIAPHSKQRFLSALIPGLISTALPIVTDIVGHVLKPRDMNEQSRVLQAAAHQVTMNFAPTATKIAKQVLENEIEGEHERFIGAILPGIASTIVNTIFNQKREMASESDISMRDCVDTIVPQAIPAIKEFLLHESEYKEDEKAEKLFSMLLPSILPALETKSKSKKHHKL